MWIVILVSMVKTRNVLIVLELNESSGRKQLSGILRFLGTSGNWNIHLQQRVRDFPDNLCRLIAGNGFDGILSGVNAGDTDEATIKLLAQCEKPVVFMDADTFPGSGNGLRRRAFIRVDDAEIGRTAARHFNELGKFRSYAFVPERNHAKWSTTRFRSFQRELARQGRECRFPDGYPEGQSNETERFDAWLQSLPKPAAIFCAWDTCALPVFAACRRVGACIPRDVSLLGVDNDEYLCNLVSPSLSSISPDFEGEGLLAARTLDRLMSHDATAPRHSRCGNRGVVERGSTRHVSPCSDLVERALAYIHDHVCEGISASDVQLYLGISRSLMDLRFQQVLKTSVQQTILKARLERIRGMLETTSYPIARITRLAGFASENHPKSLFGKTFGVSMSVYRRLHRGKSACRSN